MNATWATVPMGIAMLVDQLEARISGPSDTLSSFRWPDLPGDITPPPTKRLTETDSAFAAAKDRRSLRTTYARKVHQPRATVAEIDRAQRITSQPIATRYRPGLLAAIEVVVRIDETLFGHDATREQLEPAIRARAAAMDSALESDIEGNYVPQISRRPERELGRWSSGSAIATAASRSESHVSARER